MLTLHIISGISNLQWYHGTHGTSIRAKNKKRFFRFSNKSNFMHFLRKTHNSKVSIYLSHPYRLRSKGYRRDL